MSLERLRAWWMARLPPWTWPFNPWGDKGRPDLPERHEVANDLTNLSLRIDRLDQLRARGRLEQWREQRREQRRAD